MRFDAHHEKNIVVFNYKAKKLLDFVLFNKDLGGLINLNLWFHDRVGSVLWGAGGLAGELSHSSLMYPKFYCVFLYSMSNQLWIFLEVIGNLRDIRICSKKMN